MNKIKIAILISHMQDGGAQRIVLNNLFDLWNDPKLNILLFVLDQKSNSWCDNQIQEKGYNVLYFGNKSNYLFSNIKNKFLSKLEFIKKLKAFNPDVIHGHITPLIKSVLLPILYVGCKNIFFTLHSNPFRIKGMDLLFAKLGFNNFGIIPVCLNIEQARMAQKHYGFKKYELLHNGVDFDYIRSKILSNTDAREIFAVNKDSFVISACGRLDKIKNYPLLLDIFTKVLDKNNKGVLLIAGDGPERKYLTEYAEKLCISDKVKFLGNLDNPIPLYCVADVFVITSVNESMSLVLMEAQTCNCKCVISAGVPKESIITEKVISMKENATIDEWVRAILSDDVDSEKPSFSESDYEVHAMSQKCKEMYLKYYNEGKK